MLSRGPQNDISKIQMFLLPRKNGQIRKLFSLISLGLEALTNMFLALKAKLKVTDVAVHVNSLMGTQCRHCTPS